MGGQKIAIFDEILIVVIENTDMCYSLPDQTIVTRGIHNCIFEKNTQFDWAFILAKYFSLLLEYGLWKYNIKRLEHPSKNAGGASKGTVLFCLRSLCTDM